MDTITEMMTTDDMAEALGISSSHADKLCRQGKIQAEKLFRRWMATPAAVEKYRVQKENNFKNRTITEFPSVIEKPKKRRRRLAGDKSNMERVHARADELVRARREFLKKKFPHPKPGEIYEYVLYFMPPRGLRDNSVEYEDNEVYK